MSDKEEISIAAQLKFFCSSSGEEQDLENSGQLLHQLACVHRHRSPDKISLIQSAGLLNAAILRKPSNVNEIRQDLTDLCQHVLHLANADNKKADLIEKSTILKDSIKRLRKDVSEKLKSIEPIFNYSSKKDLEYREKDKIAKMESIQHVIAVRYNTIMWDLSKFCENVLGTRPCEFAVIKMGSLARSEITPYSDFEHVIVVEDTNDFGGNLEYFRWQGCGVRIGVGRSRRFSEGVGVGIFYPTPTPHVQFLYVLAMLTAQLTRPRAPVECFAVIFLREPCRVSRDTARDS